MSTRRVLARGWAAAFPLLLAATAHRVSCAGEESATPSGTPTSRVELTPPPGMLLVPEGIAHVGTEVEDAKALIEKNRMLKPVLASETPAQEVLVKAFFLDRTEVTNAQYKIFLDATEHPAPPSWKEGLYPEGQDDFPVVDVTFGDAEAFAHWSLRRLPTQEEFERAARGDDGRLYPWGDEWNPQNCQNGEHASPAPTGPAPVGSFEKGRGPFGHDDLCGNVAEWTSSYFLAYDGFDGKAFAETSKRSSKRKSRRRGKTSEYKKDIFIDWGIDARVVKGGTFGSFAVECRAPFRAYVGAENHLTGVGFRCAKSVVPGLDYLDGELASIDRRLPNLDREQSLGFERFEVAGERGDRITGSTCVAFVPVKSVKFATIDEFRDASRKRPQLVGVLAANLAIVRPAIKEGTYLVEYTDDKKQGSLWSFRNARSGEVEATVNVGMMEARDSGSADSMINKEDIEFHFSLLLETAKRPSRIVTLVSLKVPPDTFPNR